MLKIIFILLPLAILGCQTTGDPSQGGLLGWSEEKTQLRQYELNQNLINEQQKLTNEQNKSINNSTIKKNISSETNSIDQTLKQLDSENSKLEKDIRKLLKTKHLKETDAKRITLKLKTNDQYKKTYRQTKLKKERINEETEQIKELHDELQFLLNN